MSQDDPSMVKVRQLFEECKRTLDRPGQEMGYSQEVARKDVWQFLTKTSDPRLSMLRRFAKAMNMPITELVAETEAEPEGKRKKARKPT